MLTNKFKIKLEMLSDWQIGTGAGIPGSTDELISKDADGFPQVPAKTLVGIWRDALERLCDGLGGNWSNWVETIFGAQPNRIDKEELAERLKNKRPTYSNAILSLQPGRISKNLRAKIGKDKRLKQALTFTKVGVKIDSDSGTSETEALRFEEMGRSGTVLEAECEFDWDYLDDKQKEIVSALLILSAKMVERIGGKRRRGGGRCDFKVFDSDNKELSITKARDVIVDNKNAEIKLPESPKNNNVQANESKSEQNGKWQTCEYTLTLEAPISIVTAVLGNVSETLNFIPGTYLISHFVKHLGQDIFDAIQKGDFQISPATICIDGNRSFPVPKVFAQEKMNKKKVYNRLLESLEGKDQTKPIREGYISDLTLNSVLHATAPQTILMHNAIDDDVQRPTADVIGIYSREAIRAGTILKGEILFRNLQIADFSGLNGKVRIGTSKKDSGLAKIKFEDTKEFKPKSISKQNQLVVYLASDVMLRNGNLRQTNLVEHLAEELSKKLNLTLTETKSGQGLISSIIQVRRIESWQTSWGFPRPTLTLMQAGSVVIFEYSGNLDETKLTQIEAEGIGERRGEGYGQIIFNPKVLEKKGELNSGENENNKLIWNKAEASKTGNPTATGEIEDREFAKIIEETAWREELKIAVSKIAGDDVLKKTAEDQIFGFKGLNMSQIGGLRSAIMRLQSKADAQIVENWLRNLEKTSNRLDTWKTWRIKKVRGILKNDEVWTMLGSDFNAPKSLVADYNPKEALWAEAVKSLFYACQHAHKRDTEKGGYA